MLMPSEHKITSAYLPKELMQPQQPDMETFLPVAWICWLPLSCEALSPDYLHRGEVY